MEEMQKQLWQMTESEYIAALGDDVIDEYLPQKIANLKGYIKIEDFGDPIHSVEINGNSVDFRRFANHHIDEENKKNIGVAAFLSDIPLGFVDSAGSSRIDTIVAEEVQGMGIGTQLMYIFRSLYPFHKSGGFTQSGLKVTKNAYRMIVEQAMQDGHEIPDNVRQEHDEIFKKSSVSKQSKTAAWFYTSTVMVFMKKQDGEVVEGVKIEIKEEEMKKKLDDVLPTLLTRFKIRREPHDLNRLKGVLDNCGCPHLYEKALQALEENRRSFKKIRRNRRNKRGRGKRKR
jgi:hypothetical protein